MRDYEDFYEIAIRDIRKAVRNALVHLGLAWRVDVSFPMLITLTGRHEWPLDFFDQDGKFRCGVSFERPPYADMQWYTQEIIRQIQQKLL